MRICRTQLEENIITKYIFDRVNLAPQASLYLQEANDPHSTAKKETNAKKHLFFELKDSKKVLFCPSVIKGSVGTQ